MVNMFISIGGRGGFSGGDRGGFSGSDRGGFSGGDRGKFPIFLQDEYNLTFYCRQS